MRAIEVLNPKEIKLNQVLHGKNQDVLKDFPPNFFDSVITDAPYELGMMNKAWDASGVAYSVAMWKEVLRVAKPGATLFCFGGTRTYHRVACAIEDAGWQLKDSLMWIYGSGFPKSSNISKNLDKEAGATRKQGSSNPHYCPGRKVVTEINAVGSKMLAQPEFLDDAPATDIAKQWAGMGTALKPAFEPIILAMAPLEKGLTYAQNARKWGVAGLNIDAGRIESNGEKTGGNGACGLKPERGWNANSMSRDVCREQSTTKGRWPANVILSHSPDCVQVGTQQIKDGQQNGEYNFDKSGRSSERYIVNNFKSGVHYGQETIDVYACVPDCPIRIMDTQSGKLKSGDNCTRTKDGWFMDHGGLGKAGDVQITYGDSGGASRFFYTAKASRSERESGLKDFVPCVQCGEFGTEQHTADNETNRPAGNCIRNNHPTVKPVSIMKYLCELIKMPTRTDADGKPDASKAQVILDPFCGSGTTLLAADEVGLKYIGIDMGFDNVLIASSRSIETPPDDEPTAPVDAATLASSAAQLTTNDFNDLII